VSINRSRSLPCLPTIAPNRRGFRVEDSCEGGSLSKGRSRKMIWYVKSAARCIDGTMRIFRSDAQSASRIWPSAFHSPRRSIGPCLRSTVSALLSFLIGHPISMNCRRSILLLRLSTAMVRLSTFPCSDILYLLKPPGSFPGAPLHKSFPTVTAT